MKNRLLQSLCRPLGTILLVGVIAGCSNTSPNPPVVTNPPKSETDQVKENSEQVSSEFPYQTQIIATGLNVPWEMAFADDGRIFFTERPGQVRVLNAEGELQEEPVISLADPFISEGEGGLLGLALDPNFKDNAYLYVYHTYKEDKQIQNRVLRLRVQADNKAEIDKVLLDGIVGEKNHNGGRIAIGPEGLLYITAGDRYEPELAQDRESMGGKIFRIGLDGTIPEDNPFPNSTVYSYGHRNPQGIAWHPITGQLFSSEHGQTAHDEINRIEAGGNYGWPLIEGDEQESEEAIDLKQPLVHSGDDTWAPSGMTFVTSGPWQNELLVSNLRGSQILKLTLNEDGTALTELQTLFRQEWGRIRNVVEGPDGSIYFMTNNRDGRGNPGQDDDLIVRLVPNF